MLTEMQIKTAKPDSKLYRMRDSSGLFVEVRPSGAKVFLKQYRFGGSARTDKLGEYPNMKLATARAQSAAISEKVKQKIDPRAGRPTQRKAVAPLDTGFVPVERRFETVAEMFIHKRIEEGIADATADKLNWNLGFASKHFEGRDIGSIKPPEVLRLVEMVQATGKLEKAKDVHRKLGQVFDYAIGLGLVDWNVAQMVKRAVVRKPGGKHPGVTDPKKVGELMRAIRGYTGQATTRYALILSALTVLRSTELRAARWSEIDFDQALWTVPQERMKGHYGDHLVPLPRQAMVALLGLREWTHQEDGLFENYLFPSPTHSDRYMSNATLNSALRRLGYDTRQEHCHHGFRTTFSTNMNEQGWNRDWIERQLCHVSKDEVRATYNKALYLEGRREMMQAYADWLDAMAGHQ